MDFHERHLSERETISCDATCLKRCEQLAPNEVVVSPPTRIVQVAVSESLPESEVQNTGPAGV